MHAFRDLELTILAAALPVGFGAVLLFWLLRSPAKAAKWRPAADPVGEFRRRRSRGLARGLPIMAAGIGLMFLAYWLFTAGSSSGFFGSNAFAIAVAVSALLVLVVGQLYLHRVYRCPTCGASLLDDDGLVLNPEPCDRCGTSFE